MAIAGLYRLCPQISHTLKREQVTWNDGRGITRGETRDVNFLAVDPSPRFQARACVHADGPRKQMKGQDKNACHWPPDKSSPTAPDVHLRRVFRSTDDNTLRADLNTAAW